jgi:AGZA family xanthine/uracil permease-like MFS transporter
VLLDALHVLGDGAVLTGIVLAAATVFVIEKQLRVAGMFLLAGAVLTWFGLMHSPELGFARSPELALAYALMAGIVLACQPLAERAAAVAAPKHAEPSTRSAPVID